MSKEPLAQPRSQGIELVLRDSFGSFATKGPCNSYLQGSFTYFRAMAQSDGDGWP